jgi:hypothetical protein
VKQRLSGKGWGQIAQGYGFKLGEAKGRGHEPKAREPKTREPKAPRETRREPKGRGPRK